MTIRLLVSQQKKNKEQLRDLFTVRNERMVVGSRPGRGNSKGSFSSYQETAQVFSPEMPFYSKFGNTYSGKIIIILYYYILCGWRF